MHYTADLCVLGFVGKEEALVPEKYGGCKGGKGVNEEKNAFLDIGPLANNLISHMAHLQYVLHRVLSHELVCAPL